MSTATADHVVLTRFNLPTAGVEGLMRAREGWLSDRVALFETYTVPSIARQIHRPQWLVYFDPQSPQWLKDRLEPYVAQELFRPVYRETVDMSELVDDIRTLVPRHHDSLLTTNLDNDDGLAVDFSERLVADRTDHSRAAFYWPAGLIRSGSGLYLRQDRRNAFVSVREPWDDVPVTSWSEYHNEFGASMPVVEIKGPPGWLQVVHGANVSNRVRGRVVSPNAFRDRFGDLLEGARMPSTIETVADHFGGHPLRTARDGLRAAVRIAGLKVLGKDRYQRAKAGLAQLAHRG